MSSQAPPGEGDGTGGRATRDPDDFPISGHGRRRLLETALRLFDEEGVDAVSARSIAQAAGHRNAAAVSYHFGDKTQLIRAVVLLRASEIDQARAEVLDELERSSAADPRSALRAAFSPLVDQLGSLDGRRYLRLINQLACHPVYFREVNVRFALSLARAAEHVVPLLERLPEEARPARVQNTIGMLLYALALQARLTDVADPPFPPTDPARFLDELVDVVMAALVA